MPSPHKPEQGAAQPCQLCEKLWTLPKIPYAISLAALRNEDTITALIGAPLLEQCEEVATSVWKRSCLEG